MKLVWLPRAQQLRYAQLDYIAAENPQAAVHMDEEIEQQAEHLREHPDMGRVGRVKGTRELVVQRTPFILVYRVHPKAQRVEIWRVLHGAQQWPIPSPTAASGTQAAPRSSGAPAPAETTSRIATVLLWVRVERNSKFVRGMKRARAEIETYCLAAYSAKRRPTGEYLLQVPYTSDEDLDRTMGDLIYEIARAADLRNCFSESSARLEGTERYWD